MKAVNIYLNFNGNTETVFAFYQSIFGVQLHNLQRFKDMPSYPDAPMLTDAESNMIMHVALPITPFCTLMGTDSLEAFGQKLKVGNNFYISLEVENEAEADRLFAALSQGGSIEMPLSKTFWNAYTGMLTDQFGVQWIINNTYPL